MSHPTLNRSMPDETRHNFYLIIHKALRLGHCRILPAIGSHDFTEEGKTRDLLDELRRLIDLGRTHLNSENREIHAVLESRKPGASAHAADDHKHHEQAYAELESLIRAVEVAIPSRREFAGRALYRRYALFAADDMVHMNEEETDLLQVLHGLFTDAELVAMEDRIVAAIAPSKMAAYLRLMMPAMNHGERVAMLASMHKAMPPQVFEGVLAEAVKPSLSATEYQAAVATLGLRQAA